MIRPKRLRIMPRSAARAEAEGGGEIDVENGVPILVLQPHEQHVAGDSGVVDENVEPAERRFRSGNKCFRLFLVGQVADEDVRSLAQLGGERFERVSARSRQRHRRAAGMQCARNVSADAAAGAGHQRGLSRQIEHALPSRKFLFAAAAPLHEAHDASSRQA